MTEMLPSPRTGRAASVSSHGTAVSTSLSLQPRYVPRPDPQYISQTAAADRVMRMHLHGDQLDTSSPPTSPANAGAIFNENALALLNSFLDALLYNFLGKARSTNLMKLRPAIREVLKAKLAREALADADEEMQDLYEDFDAEMLDEEVKANGTESPDWHLEETFKLMRLRVMVFLGLGDFDDDDEERFLEEEEFHINGERASPDMSLLNGPTAVYLASVLEYLAEHLIDISSEAAYARQKRKFSTRPISESKELDNFDIEHISVEETDVERIALNPTYGRLWRTWRKQHRGLRSAPNTPIAASPRHARRVSEDGPYQNLRQNGEKEQHLDETEEQKRSLTLDDIPGEDVPEHILASNIPLPMTDNDVNEIEVPGLAKEIRDEEPETLEEEEGDRRPRSAMYFHEPFPGVVTPHDEEDQELDSRPALGRRKRSLSAPHPVRRSFAWPREEAVPGTFPEEGHGEDQDQQILEDGGAAAEGVPEEPTGAVTGEEDEDFATPFEGPVEDTNEKAEGEEKEHKGVVAGVLTGAAALVGSAIATVAGSRKSTDEVGLTDKSVHEHGENATVAKGVEEKKPESPSKKAREPTNDVPLSHEQAVAQEMGVSTPIKNVSEAAQESSDEAPLTHEEAIAREMGVSPQKKTPKEEVQPSPDPQKDVNAPANVGTVEEIPDLAAAEAMAATGPVLADPDATSKTSARRISPSQQQTSREASTQPSASVKSADATGAPRSISRKSQPTLVTQPVRSMVDIDEIDDPEAIGVAKTTNIRIHSPSPPAEQGTFGHVAGQDRRNENFARPSSRDRNVPFAQQRQQASDDESLSKPQQKQATPSPLREVASAAGAATVAAAAAVGAENVHESLKEKQAVARNRDKPLPAVQQQQAPQQGASTTTPASTVKRTTSKDKPPGERGANTTPPLQTDAQDSAAGRPPSSSYSVRSSSASQTPHSARGSQSSIQPRVVDTRVSDDVRRRNFDDLVRGEETVKYTLTPDNLREDPYNLATGRGSLQAERSGPAAPAPQVKRASPPRTSSQSSRAQQQQAAASSSPQKSVTRTSEERRSFASLSQRPQPMNTNATRKAGLMPREPRVITDEMKDFADYLRSTAPVNEEQGTPAPLAPAEAARQQPKPKGGNRMQARDPDVKGNTSSDLIDFIRRGPPVAQNGEHRIPRTVAPFRTTMDSDDFKDYSPGSSKRASANGVSTPASSTQGLITPQNTAVKPPRTTAQPTSAGQQTRLQAPSAIGGGPVRKQRRVKDPYAIDSDDEDEEDTLTALPNGSGATAGITSGSSSATRGPTIRKEESLADFLRNTEPPPNNAPQPLIGARPNGLASNPTKGPGSSPSTSSGVPKKRFEARAAGATATFQANEYRQGTNDLAKFLGSSGPPEGAAPAPNVPSGKGSRVGGAGGKRGWLGLRGRASGES